MNVESRAPSAHLPAHDDLSEADTIARVGLALATELDLDRLVQRLTDEATKVSRAQFGAFFYNVDRDDGGSYMLYTLSGAERDQFSKFGMPRATALFGPTFRGEGIVRLDDVTKDARYGKNAPHQGMPPGHLPVRSYLAVPVISRTGKVHGGLFFGHAEPGVFTERVERLVAGLAGQAAVAIDNARLYQKARAAEAAHAARARHLALLADVAVAFASEPVLDRAIARSAEALVSHLDAAFARIWTVDRAGTTLELRTSAGLYTHIDGPHARVPIGAFKIGKIAEERRPHLTNDVQHDPRVGDRAWAAREGMVAFAGYPLLVEGRLLGVVAMFAKQALAEATLEALASVADVISVGVDRKLRQEQQLRLERQQRLLVATGRELAASLDYGETLERLAAFCVPELADWCVIDTVEGGSSERAVVRHSDPARRGAAERLRRYSLGATAQQPAHVALTKREPVIIDVMTSEHIEAAAADAEHAAALRELGVGSCVAVPIATGDRVLGVITLVSEKPRAFVEEDAPFVEEIGRRAGLAIDNARLYGQAREAAAALDAARTRAEDAWRKLHQIFEQAPVLISTTRGPNHVTETANATARAVIGRDDYVGKPVAEAVPEAAAQGFIALLDEVYRTGKPYLGNETPVFLEKDGARREMYFNFVYQPLVGERGATEGILTVAVDVTPQVRARQEIERLAVEREKLVRALERSNRDLDQFAYVASHDLKAPLRGISNLSTWIEESVGPKLDDEDKKYLELLKGRVARLEGLIDGILAYSRAGRGRGQEVAVDTKQLVRDVLELLSPPATARTEVADRLPTVVADRVQLEQVFMNLLGNAFKHARRDDPVVRVDARDEGRFYRFTVEDNGPGIAREFHERIWGIFQTLEARDRVEGAGIGLAIVKKIVETRGGHVEIESAPGEGAKFHVVWPKEASRQS